MPAPQVAELLKEPTLPDPVIVDFFLCLRPGHTAIIDHAPPDALLNPLKFWRRQSASAAKVRLEGTGAKFSPGFRGQLRPRGARGGQFGRRCEVRSGRAWIMSSRNPCARACALSIDRTVPLPLRRTNQRISG
jgi:hypothetical protein